MLYKDLKATANESLFNPNKPDKSDKILLDVGNPTYWITKAVEKCLEARGIVEGSASFHTALKEAIKLLILARTYTNEKAKKAKETRNRTTRKDNEVSKTS